LTSLVGTTGPLQADRLGVAANAEQDLFLRQELATDALDSGDPDLIGVQGLQLGFRLGQEGGRVGTIRSWGLPGSRLCGWLIATALISARGDSSSGVLIPVRIRLRDGALPGARCACRRQVDGGNHGARACRQRLGPSQGDSYGLVAHRLD